MDERVTLRSHLDLSMQDAPNGPAVAAVIEALATASIGVADLIADGPLAGITGRHSGINTDGDLQKDIDVAADEMMRHALRATPVAAVMSEEAELPEILDADAPLCVAIDPLDGSANLENNISVGTIFSVLRHTRADAPTTADFLQSGRKQLAAGYALYGPSSMLVLTVGKGTHGFTLDREIGNFILTHPSLAIPTDTSEFAINTSNARFWEPPVQRYVRECGAGKTDVRERDFNMRWIASMVAEVHRILIRGGVFMYPRDGRDPAKPSRLRLLYEANPIGMLIEQAGGLASTGRGPILDVLPEALHQRVPVILGSREEVERIERYHREYDAGDDQPFMSPLFNERSLYRPETQA